MRKVEKVGIIRTLFPKPPSQKELEERKGDNVREVVRMVGDGAIYNYATEEDLEKKRQQLLRDLSTVE